MARVTVQHTGVGQGTIVGPTGFTCTSGACALDVAPNTSITLRGLAANDAWFAGMTGPCGGNFDCTFQTGAAGTEQIVQAEFTPRPNRVFVTSTATDGAFGGVAAADAICATRATAANLNGTFIAFVSDSTTNAPSRLVGSRGWVRVDGAPYADDSSAFSTGDVWFPLRLDEYGHDLGDVAMYTGTSWGATATNTCQDWTSNLGTDKGASTGSQYAYDAFSSYNNSCSNDGHFLCVETGRSVPVAIHPDTGKLAFATKTKWVPGGGRADADALCASEAAAGSLSGTFLAALGTTTESIASRFPTNQVYRRVDGVRLLRMGDMFTANWLDVPAELDQLGNRVDNDFWTGVARLDEVATAANNCNDWMDGSSTASALDFYTTRTDLQTPSKTEACNKSFPLLCIEQ